MTGPRRRRRLLASAAALGMFAVLVGLLVVATLTPDHFGDPAAPYRLVAYPVLVLLLPAVWLVSRTTRPVPVLACILVMAPFLIDTIGNIGDLYARISWWDDANHFGNWLLLCGGIGLALSELVRPRWALMLLIIGLGALLALGWEIGEWAFFYDPPYSGRLYTDTLGDEVLGTAGAMVAAVGVAALAGRGRDRTER